MSNISLTASMRSNLQSLQNTQKLFDSVQDRLATGNKVNSALDNPDSFFTAAALNNRASDLNNLMDSMGQAVQTLKAADQGIQTLTKLVEQAKSLTSTALDASIVKTEVAGSLKIDSYDNAVNKIASIDGVNDEDKFIIRSGDATKVESNFNQLFSTETALTTFVTGASTNDEMKLDVYVSDTKYTVDVSNQASYSEATVGDLVDEINNTTGLKDLVTASVVDGKLEITAKDPNDFVVVTDTKTNYADGDSITAQTDSTLAEKMGLDSSNIEIQVSAETSEDLANKITSLASEAGLDITAAIVDGKLHITDNLGSDLSIVDKYNYNEAGAGNLSADVGYDGSAATFGITGADKTGSNLRASYAEQFDGLRTQMNMIVKDTGYKGVNLLNGDDLTVIFNESRTSKLEIAGVTYDALGLGITATENEWKTNADIEAQLSQVETALTNLRAQASTFGNNLAVVQTREDFTQGMIDTLTAGADKLTLADMNEEAANMLALQTRQQLGTNSLSLASQSAQGVLRLF